MSPAEKENSLIINEETKSFPALGSKSLPPVTFAKLEGSWEQIKEGRPTCLLKINLKAPDRLRVSLRVGNTLSCTVVEKNGVISTGAVKSSNLLIPSYMHAMESRLGKLLAGLTGVTLDGRV